jgi:hypothetical protein
MNEPFVLPTTNLPDSLPKPRPLRVVRGPDGRPRVIRRGISALAALRANLPRVLRIGVIRGARIVEERILRTRETVTVGSSERNHFVIAEAGLAPRHPLFELRHEADGDRYYLTLHDAIAGRVAFPERDGGLMDLAALRASGKAVPSRRGPQVALSEDCRGKLVLGDTTLLFQFVAPPPVQPRPQLPASVRGGWLARVDRSFVTSLGTALLLHVGLLSGTMVPDWPKPTLDDILASDFSPAQMTELRIEELAVTTPDGDSPQPGRDAPDASTKPAAPEPFAPAGVPGQPTADPGTKPDDVRPRVRPDADRPGTPNPLGIDVDQLTKLETTLDLQNILADADGTGPTMGIGTPFDGESRPVTNLAEVVANMTGTGDGDGRTSSYTTMSPGALDGTAVGPLGVPDAVSPVPTTAPDHDVATDVAPQQIVRGQVRANNNTPAGGTGQMTGAAFQSVFGRKRGAIEGCYNNALVRDPTLAGDLVFLIVINQQGTVDVQVQQDDQRLSIAGVTACITGRLRTMNFSSSPPQGGDFRVRVPMSFLAPLGS